MASSDYFTLVGSPGTATTLTAPGHSLAGSTFNVVSTTNWPTTTGVIFAIDRVDANGVQVPGTYTEWEADVTSATAITGAVLRYGTDQVYAAGTNTRLYIPVTSSRENRTIAGILISHNEDGTLKNNAVTTAAIAAGAVTNAKLSTTAGEIGGSGLTYAPTYTNLALGTGGVLNYAKYTQAGKMVTVRLKITLGTGTTVTGVPRISLPVTASSDYIANDELAQRCIFNDFTGNRWIGWAVFSTTSPTTGVDLYFLNAADNLGVTSATAPFAWAVSDQIFLTLTYETP